jgi:hypothetical protein
MFRGGLLSIRGRDLPWTLEGFRKFRERRPLRMSSGLGMKVLAVVA